MLFVEEDVPGGSQRALLGASAKLVEIPALEAYPLTNIAIPTSYPQMWIQAGDLWGYKRPGAGMRPDHRPETTGP
jgi:hypothetical protein